MDKEVKLKLRKELEEASQHLQTPDIGKKIPIAVPVVFFCCKCCGKLRVVLQEDLDVAYKLSEMWRKTNDIHYDYLYDLVFGYITTCEKCRKLIFSETDTNLAADLLSMSE
jgi:hypothetical protein